MSCTVNSSNPPGNGLRMSTLWARRCVKPAGGSRKPCSPSAPESAARFLSPMRAARPQRSAPISKRTRCVYHISASGVRQGAVFCFRATLPLAAFDKRPHHARIPNRVAAQPSPEYDSAGVTHRDIAHFRLATPARPRRLPEHAYEAIRRALVGGEWVDGAPLFEDELARRLSMSRTPVREALIRLSMAGLVEPASNGGYLVRQPSLRDIREYYELRILLEPQAAALAAQAPPARLAGLLESEVFTKRHIETARFSDFHVAIAEAAENPALGSLITMVNDRISNRRLRADMTPKMAELLHEGHEQITAALRERDPDVAMRAMDAHLRLARDWVLNQWGGHDADGRELPASAPLRPNVPGARSSPG